MIITNRFDLPQSFVQMAQREYIVTPREYRVTSLLKGLRETILERRHHNEIERDVSDMIWLLFGQAVHHVLEVYDEKDTQLKEERIKVPIGDYILSGQFDLYDSETKGLVDYKTASVWKIIYKNYDDWRRQLLIYSYMMKRIGFAVEHGDIIALLKDHSKKQAKTQRGYPQLPVEKIRFEFNADDYAEIEEWIYDRFAEIKKIENLPDDELPLCTPEERFNSGDKYAVMKKGRKTALRVLDSEEDAQKWMDENGKGDYIEIRPGEDKKCADYCSVNKFCNYFLGGFA